MKESIDYGLLSYLAVALVIGMLVGCVGQPLISGNGGAISIIVNVFAILAGFLVTIMMLLSDPTLYRGATWRAAELRKKSFYRRLQRHSLLFILYLFVLALVFLASLLEKVLAGTTYLLWLERLYLGAATFAFLLSLGLPLYLMNIQMARYEEMVSCQEKNDAAAAQRTEAAQGSKSGLIWDSTEPPSQG